MAESTRTFKRLGEGTYTCWLSRIKTGQTKTGKPRVSICYKVCQGDDKGEFVWDNVTFDSQVGAEVLTKKLRALVPSLIVPDLRAGDVATVDYLAPAILDAAGSTRYKVRVSLTDRGFAKVYAEIAQ